MRPIKQTKQVSDSLTAEQHVVLEMAVRLCKDHRVIELDLEELYSRMPTKSYNQLEQIASSLMATSYAGIRWFGLVSSNKEQTYLGVKFEEGVFKHLIKPSLPEPSYTSKILLEVTVNSFLEEIDSFEELLVKSNTSKVLQLRWLSDAELASSNRSIHRSKILVAYTYVVTKLAEDTSKSDIEKLASVADWLAELKVKFPAEFPAIGWYDLKVAISRMQDTKKKLIN